MTATDETRVHQPRVRWGVVCGDGEVVWARDEGAARRLLASLVGAIRLVCEEAPVAGGVPDPDGAAASVPAASAPAASPPPPAQRTASPHPR